MTVVEFIEEIGRRFSKNHEKSLEKNFRYPSKQERLECFYYHLNDTNLFLYDWVYSISFSSHWHLLRRCFLIKWDVIYTPIGKTKLRL